MHSRTRILTKTQLGRPNKHPNHYSNMFFDLNYLLFFFWSKSISIIKYHYKADLGTPSVGKWSSRWDLQLSFLSNFADVFSFLSFFIFLHFLYFGGRRHEALAFKYKKPCGHVPFVICKHWDLCRRGRLPSRPEVDLRSTWGKCVKCVGIYHKLTWGRPEVDFRSTSRSTSSALGPPDSQKT